MKNIFEIENEIDEARGDYIRGLLGATTDIGALRTANPRLIKSFEDVLSYAKTEGKPIMGRMDASSKTVSELLSVDDLVKALSVKNGLNRSSVAQFYKGLMKSPSTDIGIIKTIAPDLVGNSKFRNEYSKFATDAELIAELKKKQYSKDAVKEIVAASKRDVDFINARVKFTGGKGTPPPPIPPAVKTKWEKIKDTLKGMSWKKMIGAATLAGIGTYFLWYLTQGEDIEGRPTQPPKASEFPICVDELVKSGEGQIQKTTDGSSVVYYKESNYYFYTNGRVYDATNKKNGTYKCEGTQIAPVNESKKLSLYTILNEAISVIDKNTMANDVNRVISDLRGVYVGQNNLNNTINILKKYIATNQGNEFLNLYQRSGNTRASMKKRVDSVFASDARTVQKKEELLDLINSIETGRTTTTTTGEKIGLKNIEITWDGKKIEGGGESRRGSEPRYFDCSQKDFPYQYGCISPRIAEIQRCKGITPDRGYFGPKTKRTLGVSEITKDMYDTIMGNCRKNDDTNIKMPDKKQVELGDLENQLNFTKDNYNPDYNR